MGFRDDDSDAAAAEPAFVFNGAVPDTALKPMVKALNDIRDHAYGTDKPLGEVKP